MAGDAAYTRFFQNLIKSTSAECLRRWNEKAVLLMGAVIAAENGGLLIDEFETAIHTSAMENTFRWILETCRKLNVQVFVTSHSKEAIDKLLKCSEQCLEDMAVYTLYKKKIKLRFVEWTERKQLMHRIIWDWSLDK